MWGFICQCQLFASHLLRSVAAQIATNAVKHVAKQKSANKARNVVVGVLVAGASLAGGSAMAQNVLLPANSGVQWGRMLGQAVGSAVSQRLVGTNTLGNGVANVVSGVITEASRNAGGALVGQAYGVQPGQQMAPGWANAVNTMPVGARDQLDTAGVRAAFAFSDYAKSVQAMQQGLANQATVNQAQMRFAQSRDALLSLARSAQIRGITPPHGFSSLTG